MKKWIAFDIGTCMIQMAVIQNGQPFVKSYSLSSEENIYYTNDPKLNEGRLSFVTRFIKLYKATDVVFVIPPNVNKTYTSALYDVARKELTGEIRFIESSNAAIALYSYLIGRKCNGNNLVIDFGYRKTILSFKKSGKENDSETIVFDTLGVSHIDNQLLSYINKKEAPCIYKKQEICKAREGLSYGYSSHLSQDNGCLCEFNRDEFNAIFDLNMNYWDALKKYNDIDRIFLIGGGSLIPRFTELLLQRVTENGLSKTRIIRGLKTNKGSYHCQTAPVIGALIHSTNKNDSYLSDSLLLKQCSNPYCRIVQSEKNVECETCNVNIEAEAFYRCSNCGTVVTNPFFDNNNNFCCYCGKHKMELINNI